ncbi:RING finger protein 150 [Lingula anatina]|uniref:RING finger protein 150 n=1 Tax=Lingula anatina TaxID=7574 RepID=A0A1S3K1V1_LINAN|nr:RING finger protein 150 [Lingula anatina]|eukprot:XP_013416608.1 RING finger protein 150 [Lingula anatina]
MPNFCQLKPFFTSLVKAPSVGARSMLWFQILCVLCGHQVITVLCANDVSPMSDSGKVVWAIINITYKDPVTKETVSYTQEMGKYGNKGKIGPEHGIVVHVRTEDNQTHGCTAPKNKVPPNTRWIALIKRGHCRFHDKVYNAAKVRNASAVIIYNDKEENDLIVISHQVNDVVSIFIKKEDGEKLAALVDNNTRVTMNISVGTKEDQSPNQGVNRTSVLFVSISFIVLMIISLAWLIFYYVQRFRYAHAKERLTRRLTNAAKKAIQKIPVRTLKSGDKETETEYEQCAVCIENYRPHEVVRILPCRHMFHKSCVDPWLLEQRSCPICKTDILKAYGVQVKGLPQDSSTDVEAPATTAEASTGLSGGGPGLVERTESGVQIVRIHPPIVQLHHPSPGHLAEDIVVSHTGGPEREEEEAEDEEEEEERAATKLQSTPSMECLLKNQLDEEDGRKTTEEEGKVQDEEEEEEGEDFPVTKN